jgi:hypothetical protein
MTSLIDEISYLKPTKGNALASLLPLGDGIQEILSAGIVGRRNQTRNLLAMASNHDCLPLLDSIQELGEMGLGFIGTDGTHETPQQYRPV